jgi:hypothetical protein
LDVIAGPLHCNTIQVYGEDVARLVRAAELADARERAVWVQPRLVNASPGEHLTHLPEAARSLEQLQRRGAAITLSVGAELTLFLAGFVTGATMSERLAKLSPWTPMTMPIQTSRAHGTTRLSLST